MKRTSGAARRDSLVGWLALATGSLDVIGFTRLGGVFTSVMTGNIALLGLAAGRHDAQLALRTGVSFLGYLVGAGLGTVLAGQPEPRQSLWPRRVSLALFIELLMLILFCSGWEVWRQSPAGDGQMALLSLAAAAMGLQSVAVARLAIPGLSSTHLTGTLAAVVSALVSRNRKNSQVRRGLLAVGALALGAAVGGLLVAEVPWAAPIWTIGVVGSVAAASARLAWSDQGRELVPPR